MIPPAAQYRLFAPSEELRDYVRAFFCFAPPSRRRPRGRALMRELEVGESNPMSPCSFADGRSSVVFLLEQAYEVSGRWRSASTAPRAQAIGPTRSAGVGPAHAIPERVGVFLHAGRSELLLGVPATELTERAVALQDLWGAEAAALMAELAAACDQETRIDRLESALLRRLVRATAPEPALDAPGIARWIAREGGRVRIEQVAEAAGVSRQHFTRAFRSAIGVTPKQFARLARFQAALAHVRRGEVNWARAALELGYADQSHMIADFRRFSGMTPESLGRGRWFHPFIELARRPIMNDHQPCGCGFRNSGPWS